MLSAFTARPIVELRARDKFRIESIIAYGDRLLVGLSTGTLRIYRINEGDAALAGEHSRPSTRHTLEGESTLAVDAGPAAEEGVGEAREEQEARDSLRKTGKEKIAELLSERDKFSSSKIEQLAIIKEANILVSLSNGFVSIHDLHSCELQERLSRTKGATAFAVTSNIVKDPSTGVPAIVSRLAVAVKRRLMLWSWHDMELEDGTVEIALVSGIRTLTWASERKIMAGLSSSYFLVDVQSQEATQIVGPGSIGGNPAQESGRLGGMGVETMKYIGMGAMVPKPLATRLGEGEMLLAKDINTLFITRDGEPLGRRQIPWRAAPEAIGYSYPYLLSLQEATKGTLEVRNPHTLSLLQSITLPGASLLQVAQPNISLAHAGKGFLVASERTIWRMGAFGYDSQIDALVERDHLDEAISLLGMLEDALLRDKEGRLREVKMRKAQRLFDTKMFQDSLDLFTEVAAPPDRVIKLYPSVISGDLADDERSESQAVEAQPAIPAKETSSRSHGKTSFDAGSTGLSREPADISNMPKGEQTGADQSESTSIYTPSEHGPTLGVYSEKELKTAARALQGFLADVRRRVKPFFDEDQRLKDASEVRFFGREANSETRLEHLLGLSSLQNIDREERLRAVATLVDTTLFRTHMYVTPYLVGALFRIPNFCDPGVVMEKLEGSGRYNDLIEFLFGKRLHRQALERLQKFGQATTDGDESAARLRGPARTVTYLQNLAPEFIDLVLEFAEWLLRADPEIGMQIFIADTENAETLPRDKVVNFLEGIDPAFAQRYLEHVIDELNDETPALHQRLLTLYFDRLKQWQQAVRAGDTKEAKDNREIASRFLTLLRTSTQYSPARLLGMLPRDGNSSGDENNDNNHDDDVTATFHHARALVFSKMGQHRQALEIYVFKLRDTAKAEEYCNQVHMREDTVATSLPASRRRSTTDPDHEQPSIYHTLLGLYLNPPKNNSNNNNKAEQQNKMWGPAIEILARHGARLPTSSTLALIPESLPVRDLEFYFRGRLRAANTVVSASQLVAGLSKVEAGRLQAALLLGEGVATAEKKMKMKIGQGVGAVDDSAGAGGRGRRVRIDDERVCGVCYKRIGASVISVFPDNSVVHLGCANRKQKA